MYDIVLVDSSTCWKGDKGVVMHCKVIIGTGPSNIQPADITVWGITEPTVWVKAMDASSGYVDPTIITDPIINDNVRKWLYSSPVLAEWYEEAARYRSALAKVDLPYPPEDVQSESKYLTYKFVVEGGRGYSIPVVLEVDADTTRVTIGLQEVGNDDRYVHVGTASIAGAVTEHRVKCVVGDTIYDFIGDMRDLVREVSVYGRE